MTRFSFKHIIAYRAVNHNEKYGVPGQTE